MNKDIKKIILSAVLLLVLFISTFSANKNNKYETSGAVSYASQVKKEYAKTFIAFITYGKYEEAYDLLTDECKNEIFENNFEKFTETMKSKIYEYGKMEKSFTYESPVKCIENGKEVYSQEVTVSHRSVGNLAYNDNGFGYDIYEYFKVKSINFIIYEENPYDYKLYIQLIES